MNPTPIEIRLQKRERQLLVSFDDGSEYALSFEYLRVFSPSAEVQGHGPGQDVLQIGKQDVVVTAIEPVGHYAVRLIFDDGHDTGLYTWQHLHGLGRQQQVNWSRYLDRLEEAGYPRPKTADSPPSQDEPS